MKIFSVNFKKKSKLNPGLLNETFSLQGVKLFSKKN